MKVQKNAFSDAKRQIIFLGLSSGLRWGQLVAPPYITAPSPTHQTLTSCPARVWRWAGSTHAVRKWHKNSKRSLHPMKPFALRCGRLQSQGQLSKKRHQSTQPIPHTTPGNQPKLIQICNALTAISCGGGGVNLRGG